MGEETGSGTGGTVTEKLDKLLELIDKDKGSKEKKFKFPKLSNGKMKKNYVIAIILKTNKQMDIKKLRVEDMTVFLKDNKTYHLALTDFVMRYKKWPVIILPEWDLQPISIDELQNKTISEHRLALPQKIIIERMAMAQLNKKKGSLKGVLIIVGVIAAAAVIYFIISSMTKKKV